MTVSIVVCAITGLFFGFLAYTFENYNSHLISSKVNEKSLERIQTYKTSYQGNIGFNIPGPEKAEADYSQPQYESKYAVSAADGSLIELVE